jgi:hypothetical protein
MTDDPWLEHERLVDEIRDRGWTVYTEWNSDIRPMAVRRWTMVRRPTLERLHSDIVQGKYDEAQPPEPDASESERRPETAEDVWDSLGGYVEKLAPIVETYLHSQDAAERLHAFNKLDKYRRKASDGRHATSVPFEENRYDDYGEAIERGRKNRELTFGGRGAELSETSVSRKLTGRRDRPRDAAAADVDAARVFLEKWAIDNDTTLVDLAAPSRRGKPSKDEAVRLRLLARAVSAARAAGFTQAAIGEVIDRDKRRVSELEKLAA